MDFVHCVGAAYQWAFVVYSKQAFVGRAIRGFWGCFSTKIQQKRDSQPKSNQLVSSVNSDWA